MQPAGWSLIDDPEASDREAAVRVDAGLDVFNGTAAPLHDVRPLACYARAADGLLLGGLTGRCWGRCAELQRLWVDESWRGHGIGTALVRRFESLAIERGCTLAYLDTFSFQAPAFYRRLGWTVVRTLEGFAPGIAKHAMEKRLG